MEMKYNFHLLTISKLTLLNIALTAILLATTTYSFVYQQDKASSEAELQGQKIVFSVDEQKLVSQTPIYVLKQHLEQAPAIKPVITPETKPDDMNINTIADDGKPIIAIIIGGLGLSKSSTIKAIDLPKEISFGFSSYASNIDEYMSNPEVIKHNILINLPLEPVDYPADDPGPHALLTELSDQENVQRLEFVLGRIINFQGVYSNNDEKFTRALTGAKILLSNFKQKKLIYVYGLGSESSTISQLAEKIGFHILINDVILDEMISQDAISKKLVELEQKAQQNGSAIAVGNPYPLTVDMVDKWLPSLAEKGIKLVSITDFNEIVQQRKRKNIK